MKNVDQTIFDPENGNCMAACVASILELPLPTMPNPHGDDGAWYHEWIAFLKPHNLQILIFQAGGEVRPWGYSILCGKSPRGDWNHCVVCYNGEMVHDPHPDRTGVESEIDWTVFVALDPAPLIATRAALLSAEGVMWMAYEYAMGGGSRGPEMRDYAAAQTAINTVLYGADNP